MTLNSKQSPLKLAGLMLSQEAAPTLKHLDYLSRPAVEPLTLRTPEFALDGGRSFQPLGTALFLFEGFHARHEHPRPTYLKSRIGSRGPVGRCVQMRNNTPNKITASRKSFLSMLDMNTPARPNLVCYNFGAMEIRKNCSHTSKNAPQSILSVRFSPAAARPLIAS